MWLNKFSERERGIFISSHFGFIMYDSEELWFHERVEHILNTTVFIVINFLTFWSAQILISQSSAVCFQTNLPPSLLW